MKKIGITGQAGFVGTHLFNTLAHFPEEYERVPFDDAFFADQVRLEEFVSECDVIVHLAAMNRHNDPQTLYETNLRLVNQVIGACEKTGAKPHILFSSSTQEERDNLYGKSKREGRELFEQWARRAGARFTGLVIPNVFGPFGHPYYNSVVATFCHQLTHGEQPRIDVDGEINLIYVGDLVRAILEMIGQAAAGGDCVERVQVPHQATIRVTELLSKLSGFKEDYFDRGVFPDLSDPFERDLFNTFVCYIDHKALYPVPLKLHTDARGSFVETVKLKTGGQVSFSTTVPGVTRGNHYHIRKAERFAVIRGKARIELRRLGTDQIMSFELDGGSPSYVDMPIWHAHNITNIGNEDLFTIFWISEHYDPSDPDTYFETV
ncbi:MAG: NAD-dependent epimerase/dehydratase family protein [Verrucomicrobia bacterium]|nr:NAD-dependent epimerase/dehydratase family protein [Verrucomicrobiota bacterium]